VPHVDVQEEEEEPDRVPRADAKIAKSRQRSSRAAEKLASLGEMTAGIAHDLRNILAVVDAGLSLAARSAEQPDKVRFYIDTAREGVVRGTETISQLLKFAREEEIETGAADTNRLLQSLLPFLEYGSGPGIRIVFDLTADLPKCRIDASQFNAAILNLVINARDAMPTGGDIVISTERCRLETGPDSTRSEGTYVRVRVKDCGPGMPPHVLRQVLDPFFTTKGEKGTGLGLPQVSAFMRMSNGHLDISSTEGGGTTVDLLFPCTEQGS
jgi:signal transduction histidine kinase